MVVGALVGLSGVLLYNKSSTILGCMRHSVQDGYVSNNSPINDSKSSTYKDLISYLERVADISNQISEHPDYINYEIYILGYPDKALIQTALDSLGLADLPESGTVERSRLLSKVDKLLRARKVKYTARDKLGAYKAYCSLKAKMYERILPTSDDLETIHKDLIKSNLNCEKAWDALLIGNELGYIRNIIVDGGGQVQWDTRIGDSVSESYGVNYKRYADESVEDFRLYVRAMLRIMEKYGLNEDRLVVHP